MTVARRRRLVDLARRRTIILASMAAVGVPAMALAPLAARADGQSPTFTAEYVSTSIGGGEPFVIYSKATGNLIYSGHEGTTHIDKNFVTTPGSSCDIQTASGFICSYDNHVNDWYSTDNGKTWTRSLDSPINTGFSDPSLTEDAAGNVYNTGIDLANDALFLSADGGKSFVTGTPQCSQGDRPWLAGGTAGEVFLGTDLELGTHTVFKGFVEPGATPGGNQQLTIVCSKSGISHGAAATSSGIGSPMAYDSRDDSLIEPIRGAGKIGIGVLPKASSAFGSDPSQTPTGAFVDRMDSGLKTSFFDAIQDSLAISQGSDNTIYVVWATGDRDPAGKNGCGSYSPVSGGTLGKATLLPNKVMMAWTGDEGLTWSAPVEVAGPDTTGGTTMVWPWVTAGAAGNVSVAWFQADQSTDPDCDSAALLPNGRATNWTLQVANVFGATDPATAYPPASVNAIPNFDGSHKNGVFHVGGICQSGTTCAATGQDRRLGDYFTNALDKDGCVMVATTDTQLVDPVTGTGYSTGRPLFVHQSGGNSLTTGLPCGAPTVGVPEAPLGIALPLGGLVLAGAFVAAGRIRRRGPVPA